MSRTTLEALQIAGIDGNECGSIQQILDAVIRIEPIISGSRFCFDESNGCLGELGNESPSRLPD